VWLLACNWYNIKPTTCFLKDGIHFFQGPVCCFRIEEIDYRNGRGIAINILVYPIEIEWHKNSHGSPYNPSPIPNSCKHHRRNHNNQKVE
jgi:hypothetical protein